jgi:hypothetical protein
MSNWQDQNPYAPPLAEEVERSEMAATRARDLLLAATDEASKALPWTAMGFSALALAIMALLAMGLVAIWQQGWIGFAPLGIGAIPAIFAATLWRLRQSILRLQARRNRQALAQVIQELAWFFVALTLVAGIALSILLFVLAIDLWRIFG